MDIGFFFEFEKKSSLKTLKLDYRQMRDIYWNLKVNQTLHVTISKWEIEGHWSKGAFKY